MAVTYVDQVMAYLALSANRTAFIDAISLAAFAGTSFTRRYGSNGFQVDSVSLDPPGDFQIQQLVQDDLRITGFSDKRTERHERKWIDYSIRKQQVIGWIDAAFTTQTSLALHAVPGSAVLGPQGTVEQAGTQSAPPPTTWRSNFLLALTTDQFSLSYPTGQCLHGGRSVSDRRPAANPCSAQFSRGRSGFSCLARRVAGPAPLAVRPSVSRRCAGWRAAQPSGDRAVVR